MQKRGVSRLFVQNFLSHSTEKLRRGTLLCSRKTLVSKNVRDKTGGEYHNFPSKFFCLTVPKNFVGEPFSVSMISGIENFYASEGYATIFDFMSVDCSVLCFRKFTVGKILWMRRGGGGIKLFRRKILLSHSAEISVGESFAVALISGIEKVWIRGGEYQDFPSKIFCLTVPKNFLKEPFSVSLIRVSKTVEDKS